MSEAAEKKKRSPVERLIVWGLIAAMLVVVFIEYRASQGYNAMETYLQAEISKRPTIDELKAKFSSASVSDKQKDAMGTEEVEFSFFSIFKADAYKLRVQLLEVSDDVSDEEREKMTAGGGRAVDYYQPAGLAAVREEAAKAAEEASKEPTSENPGAPPQMDDPGMGGTGGGEHGTDRPDEDGPDEGEGEGDPEADATEPEEEGTDAAAEPEPTETPAADE